MAGRGTDILLGGNPEYMARQQSLNEGVAEKVIKGEEKYVDDDEFVNFFHIDSFYRVQARRLGSHLHPLQAPVRRRAQASRQPRRPAHRRHRTARSPPHRQPAARPRRPPGRSGLVALLPVARRRPDAHLRLRPHLRPDAAARHGRRRADRTRHGQPRHRARAEAGRSAELRRPQAPARVRRRDEQAARERLHAAPRDPRGQDSPQRRRNQRHPRLRHGHGRRTVRREGRRVHRPRGRDRRVGHPCPAARAHAAVRARRRRLRLDPV